MTSLRATSLLPPNSTPLERSLERAMRADITWTKVGQLKDPATCPIAIIPFLAWELAITHWDTTWTEAEKRTAVAGAVAYHRIKGTKAAVKQALARYDDNLNIVEWWEMSPRGVPHTFEVRANALEIPASFLTQDVAQAIIEDVAVAKPLRAHFAFVQNLDLASTMHFAGGGAGGAVSRADYAAGLDDSRDWDALLQTEDGEPIQDGETTDFLETA